MESAALTPSSSIHVPKTEEWKSLKRISDRYLEPDESSLSGESEEFMLDNAQTKRFKSLGNSALDDSCFESPVNVGAMLRPKRIFQNESRFQEIHNNHHGILSPITEISMNLNETSLNSDHSMVESQIEVDHGFDDGTTPIKRFRSSGRPKLFSTESQLYNEDAKIISTKGHCIDDKLGDEETLNCLESSFQIQRSGRNPSSRRLNLDASMSDMAMEELSFYDDDHVSQNRHFTASPQFMGLLSPEGSPQRFQVVEKSKFLQSRKNFPLTAKNVNRSTTLSTNTPSKGFRLLHSMSSTGSMESSMDDEYMEFFDMENLDQPSQSNGLNFPSDLSSLISGQIIKNSPVKTPEMRRPSVRRCLSMTENTQFQPKTPETVNASNANTATTPFSARLNGNCCFKRPEPPSTTCSPIQSKRYRGAEKENLDGSFTGNSKTSPATSSSCSSLASTSTSTRPTLRKCMSMNDAEIMSALNRSENKDEPDLIGDFSRPYALPLIEGRHRDLKSITSHTVARLLNGDFNDKVASYKIIDCRYPYEYEGGHIEGAKNLYTQEQIIEEFMTKQKTEQQQRNNEASGNKRNIIIFHCEFSSERGPKLSRFLRNLDRERNTNVYPALDYPEIYLLHNGYKEFFETHVEHCTPHSYRPMLEPSYNEEYRHFRAKSKSWNGDGLGGATQRIKKSRSRLMV
ncbi:M-phase inducer phosphatase isoform X1 [Lucilia cuprina]|uniref:M-phase inducer phosphatase isoform X1 n=1 Tax=Lucilia cuprina TaxID=7375 RepID=UPI001F06ED6C|nr:M-phase inducer phosphatase isoform X1 [Lucilia cuprina]